MHIGLIGGIGPAATVAYCQRLCAAMAARGARPDLTIVQADIHTLIRNNLADRRMEQTRIYARLIDRLKAAGADCAAITSLGGHFSLTRRWRGRRCRWCRRWCRWMRSLLPRGSGRSAFRAPAS